MNALPHFLYGPGHDALSLTVEYGGHSMGNKSAAQVLLSNLELFVVFIYLVLCIYSFDFKTILIKKTNPIFIFT